MSGLTPGEAQDLLADYKRAWERRDVDLMLSLFSADAEYRHDPFEEALIGDNAIREYWNDAAASHVNPEFDAERTWVVAATVLTSWHGAFTRAASGERIRLRGFMSLELDDERHIARLREWTVSRTVGIDATHKPGLQEAPDGR